MVAIRRAVLVALVLVAALSGRAAAQGQKFAYITSSVLLEQAPGRAAAESLFAREAAPMQEQIKRMSDSLDAMVAAFEKRQASLTVAQREAQGKEIQGRQASYQQRARELQDKQNARQGELVQPILDRIKAAIEDVRVEGGYAFIFNADQGVADRCGGQEPERHGPCDREAACKRLHGGHQAVFAHIRSVGRDATSRAPRAVSVADGQDHVPYVGGGGQPALTAESIAGLVNGALIGDASALVTGIAPLDRAEPHHLSFLATAKYAPLLVASSPGVLLVTPELAEVGGTTRARVVVADPHDAMLSLLATLYPVAARTPGVHATAVIGDGAVIGRDVEIGPYVVVGPGASIGDRTTLRSHTVVGAGVSVGADCDVYESVTLYAGAVIGDRVRIHAGARIASDGFGYVFRNGAHDKIPHVGRCIVESDVEIGANSTLDRGSIDDTVIGAGTRIDNLVHIAHNVRVGKLCLIMAQVGVAGSVRIGDGCILAGQVGVSGHHTVGAGARLAAQAGVFGDIPAGETWSGYPARPHREALRAQAALFRLPALIRAIERLP